MKIKDIITESRDHEYILYVNGRPAAKYVNLAQAERDIAQVKKKNPSTKFELKQEVCNMVTVPLSLNGTVPLRLSEALLDELATGDDGNMVKNQA